LLSTLPLFIKAGILSRQMNKKIITTFITAAVTISTVTVPVTEYTTCVENYNYESNFQQTSEEPDINESNAVGEDEKLNCIYANPKLFDLLRTKPECYGSKKNFTYHYLYFCSTIWFLNNVDRRYQEEEYANINFKTMISVISRERYTEIVNNLLNWNIIERNPYKKYQVGFYSNSYRLKEPYTTGVKRIPIEDRLISRKINQHRRKKDREIEKLPHSYQYLKITNTFIDMDIASATKYNIVNYQITHPKKYDANYYSISEYSDYNYRFSVDTFGNRAHTNITNLSSKLRKFLSVDGEPLGQIDISNSQPLFFSLHINNVNSIPQFEKDNYQRLVESGSFYEFFLHKLNIPLEKREKVKHKILAAVFFDYYRKNDSRYIKVFRQDFPSISEYITRRRKKDHRTLAKILQKTESKFVIEGFVSEFINQFGDSNEFIATIHDSVVVKASFLEMTKGLMENFFLSKGINPNLKIELF